MIKEDYVLRQRVINITVEILDITVSRVLNTTNNNDRRTAMNQTAKQAKMTVSIKTDSGIESYFFYDMAQYGQILQAIDKAQTGAN